MLLWHQLRRLFSNCHQRVHGAGAAGEKFFHKQQISEITMCPHLLPSQDPGQVFGGFQFSPRRPSGPEPGACATSGLPFSAPGPSRSGEVIARCLGNCFKNLT